MKKARVISLSVIMAGMMSGCMSQLGVATDNALGRSSGSAYTTAKENLINVKSKDKDKILDILKGRMENKNIVSLYKEIYTPDDAYNVVGYLGEEMKADEIKKILNGKATEQDIRMIRHSKETKIQNKLDSSKCVNRTARDYATVRFEGTPAEHKNICMVVKDKLEYKLIEEDGINAIYAVTNNVVFGTVDRLANLEAAEKFSTPTYIKITFPNNKEKKLDRNTYFKITGITKYKDKGRIATATILPIKSDLYDVDIYGTRTFASTR